MKRKRTTPAALSPRFPDGPDAPLQIKRIQDIPGQRFLNLDGQDAAEPTERYIFAPPDNEPRQLRLDLKPGS